MRLRALLLGLWVGIFVSPDAAAGVAQATFEGDAVFAAGAWKPQGESRAPVLVMGGDMKRALRFQVQFGRATDWRVYWDLDVKADLSRDDQIVITLRASDPSAVSQGVLYVRSGPGWYRMPPFIVGKDWAMTVLSKAQAVAEGAPTGWNAVDGLRIAFLPADKRATIVELASLNARNGWPLSHLGAVGGHADLKHSAAAFRASAKGQLQEADVEARLKQAEALEGQAVSARDADTRQALILEGRSRVAQAYAQLQAPKDGEFRGLWVHHGDGVRAQGADRVKRWKDALPEMKAQGYNAVLPNVLWSGVAYYPSALVPNHPGVAREGDYLKEILDAARPLGMKVHAWKVMWQFAEGWLAPSGVSEPFRRAGRLQRDSQGRELPWLCPCDERNRSYELDAIKELAAGYEVDGIHLDYIRWNGDQGSFTSMCRERFETWSKAKVAHWPQDVLASGSRYTQWQDFKREVITSFVRETRTALRTIKPGLQLSAAVFPDPAQARATVFQDWPLWVKEGLVDWVSTMTYNEDALAFKAALVQQHSVMVNPAVKLYPGMQFTLEGGRSLALESAVDEIKAVREVGLEGFVVFEWRDQLQDGASPNLRAGLLRDDRYTPVASHLREVPAYAKVSRAQRGRALGLKPTADGSVLLDDFEDGSLVNRAQGRWGLETDANKLGTQAGPLPLRAQAGGAEGSKFSLGFKGHLGTNRPPGSYALLHSAWFFHEAIGLGWYHLRIAIGR